MRFPPPPRNLRAELLDIDEASFLEVRDSLADVRIVNKYFGGNRVLLQHVAPFLKTHDSSRPFTIVDLATGSADQPMAVARLARRLGIPVCITALDINKKMLAYAHEEIGAYPEIALVAGDAFALPFRDGAFDLAINSLSLHHFSGERAVMLIQSLYALGRRGFVVNDLERSRRAYLWTFAYSRLCTRNRLTRYDAPVSVMNAFTSAELGRMARAAGVADGPLPSHFAVHRHFPGRMALVVEKG